MLDILMEIYYGELTGMRGKPPLEPPYSIEESRVQRRLCAMDPKAAKEFRREIRALVVEQRDAAFRSGVRFGAQLTAQLMEDF